jgi:hypothetical protein
LNKILLILLIILTSIFWAFVFYAPIEYSQGEYQISKDDSSYLNITNIQLNYNAEMSSVNIKFIDDMHYILNSNWNQITSAFFPYEPIEIHFQETFLDNNTLEINVTSTGEGFFDSDWNLFYEFEIIVDNSYLIDFNSEVSYSEVNIEASDTEFGNFNLNSESGGLDVVFRDVYIHSPVSVSILSGSTDFNIYNSNITSDINFLGDSGSLFILAYDSVFADINTQTSSGYNILVGNSNIFKNVSLETSSGYVEMDIGISNIQNIDLTSLSGHIDLLMDDIILAGDISILSTSGAVDCEFDEISFNSNRTFDIKSDSGYVEFSWDQEMSMNFSAHIFIETSSGAIDVEISTLLENLNLDWFILDVSSDTGFTEVDLYEGEYI